MPRYLIDHDLRICKMFTLLTNGLLFNPMASVEHNASETEVLLYQMISFCGEFFHGDFLRSCSRSTDYFKLDCASLFSSLVFRLIDGAYDQADSRNSSVIVANLFSNVLSIVDVYWILKTWQTQRIS